MLLRVALGLSLPGPGVGQVLLHSYGGAGAAQGLARDQHGCVQSGGRDLVPATQLSDKAGWELQWALLEK